MTNVYGFILISSPLIQLVTGLLSVIHLQWVFGCWSSRSVMNGSPFAIRSFHWASNIAEFTYHASILSMIWFDVILILILLFACTIYQSSSIPFPLYPGSNLGNIGIDHGNCSYLLLVMMTIPLILIIGGYESSGIQYSWLMFILLIMMFIIFTLELILYLIVYYELLFIVMFIMLLLFIVSFYRIRTAFYHFTFTIIGSIVFSLSSLLLSFSDNILSELLSLYPLPIKVPLFPYLYRSPEIHGEANTSISMFMIIIS